MYLYQVTDAFTSSSNVLVLATCFHTQERKHFVCSMLVFVVLMCIGGYTMYVKGKATILTDHQNLKMKKIKTRGCFVLELLLGYSGIESAGVHRLQPHNLKHLLVQSWIPTVQANVQPE